MGNKKTSTNSKSKWDDCITLFRKDWEFILNSDNLEEVQTLIQKKLSRKKIEGSEDYKSVVDKVRIQKKELLIKKAEEFRDKLVKNQTEAELKFKAILKMMKVAYDFQKIIYIGKSFYIVDFYLPDYNTIIEVDGGYHKEATQRKKDWSRTYTLRNMNKKVFRINNEDVNNVEELMERVTSFLK